MLDTFLLFLTIACPILLALISIGLRFFLSGSPEKRKGVGLFTALVVFPIAGIAISSPLYRYSRMSDKAERERVNFERQIQELKEAALKTQQTLENPLPTQEPTPTPKPLPSFGPEIVPLSESPRGR